jgi:hypothetical protein
MTNVVLDLVDSAGRAIAGSITFTPTYDGIAGGPPYDATPIEADLVDPPEAATLLPSSQVGPYEVRARRSLGGGIVFSGLLNIPEAGNYSLNALLDLRKAAVANTKQFVSSVNGLTGDVTIPAGEGTSSKTLPFSEELVFDAGIVIYGRANAANGLAFSANLAGAIPGSTAVLELVATGGTAPDFSEFKPLNGSSGWVNDSGIINLVVVYYFGPGRIWYTVAQEEGQVPIDIAAPTLVSAVIPNAAPSTVILTFSEALAVRATPTSAFAISGKTITGFAQSGSTVTLTVSVPFVAGASATVAYTQPGSNRLQDAVGNQVANIAATAITNNVAAPTIPLTIASQTGQVTVSGTTYTNNHAPGYNGYALFAQRIPANTDGYVEVGISVGFGVFGLNLTNALHWYGEAPNGYEYGVVPGSTGFWRYMTGGVASADTAVALAGGTNKRARLRRTAGVISAEASANGTTWTTIYTWPGIQNAALYVNYNWQLTGDVALNPIGSGVV